MAKVLLIEDSKDIQLIVKSLLENRFKVSVAHTAAESLALLHQESFELVLLDVGLPDANGFEFFPQLRAHPNLRETPIIFLTGKSDIQDRVAGFSLGAEDYIVKPFEPLEFRARIEAKVNAQLRRHQSGEQVRKGRIELDRAKLRAYARDASGKLGDLELTPHEFRLLSHFLAHEGETLSRKQLMDTVWGGEVHVLERTIDRHVSSLRKKLDPRCERLEPVHGVGYRFTIQDEAKRLAA